MEQAAAGPEVRRAPWPNFQLCPSSQQILATPLSATFNFIIKAALTVFCEWSYTRICQTEVKYIIKSAKLVHPTHTHAILTPLQLPIVTAKFLRVMQTDKEGAGRRTECWLAIDQWVYSVISPVTK